MKSWMLALGLACTFCGCRSATSQCTLVPSLNASECDTLQSLRLEVALPAARGSAFADNQDAALLGFAVFYDARFSSNSNIRCASCHVPEKKFSDGEATSQNGLAPVSRRAPTALNAARMRTFFWDGRVDSLWSQPLRALENPKEMNFSRLEIAHRLAKTYQAQYEKVFGPLPALADETRFPLVGKPGDAAWEAMAQEDKNAIDGVVANLGKAIEAYVRKIAAGASAVDRFLDGDKEALSESARRGLSIFVRAGCIECHSGPLLSDQKFHNLGVPAAAGAEVDEGRTVGLTELAQSEFNAASPWWDGDRISLPGPATTQDLGAFRTPTLRNALLAPPYMHNGAFATLEEAVRFHLTGGGRGKDGFVGDVDPLLVPRNLSDGDVADLVAMLNSLAGDYPPPPWNDWPQR